MIKKFQRHRFKVVRQNDSRQCGAACIAMIARHYGKLVNLASIDEIQAPDAEGLSLAAISSICEHLGFETLSVRIEAERLKALPMPCILHWDKKHYVVLYGFSKNAFLIADPARGCVRYPTDEFLRHWAASEHSEKGIALLLQPTDKFSTEPISKAQSYTDTLKFLGRHFFNYRRYFFHILLGLAVGCLLQLVAPFLTQAIVDAGIRNANISLIWLILLGELFIVCGRTLTDFLRRWILLHISNRINISLLSEFFIKLLKLPMKYFDSKNMGDLMQRLTDHSRVETFLTMTLLDTFFAVMSFLIFGIVLFFYNNLIFLIFIVGAMIQGWWILLTLKRRKALDYEMFEAGSRNNNTTVEFLNNMQEIKLHGCGRRRRWDWENCQADLFCIRMKTLKLDQIRDGGTIFIKETENILITVLSALAVIQGELSLGGMLAVQYMVGQLSSPLQQLVAFILSCQDVKISLDRINDIHLTKNEDCDSNASDSTGRTGDITLSDVEFKYDVNSSRNVIQNLSLTIPAGKVTAIVGVSGSGKTTLLKLMLGFYPPTSGTITIGGTDLSLLNKEAWRSKCGVVMQDGVVFSESIARNIAVNDEEIDWDKVKNAARLSRIDSFIEKLPLQYDTVVGRSGVGLSKGQIQRLLIARAIYRNPEYIFLDEATNSLDAENEHEIVENLEEFYKNRTVIVVAHRLSTVRNADMIVVIDNGMIKEQGSHSQLIALKGAYYNLIKNQLELGL